MPGFAAGCLAASLRMPCGFAAGCPASPPDAWRLRRRMPGFAAGCLAASPPDVRRG